MTTMELRADIFENLNFLLDNEEAMTQLKKYLCQLRNKVERDSPCKYDVGELTQRVRQGVQDARQGLGQSHDDLVRKIPVISLRFGIAVIIPNYYKISLEKNK